MRSLLFFLPVFETDETGHSCDEMLLDSTIFLYRNKYARMNIVINSMCCIISPDCEQINMSSLGNAISNRYGYVYDYYVFYCVSKWRQVFSVD